MSKKSEQQDETQTVKRSREKAEYLIQQKPMDPDGEFVDSATPTFNDTASAKAYILKNGLIGRFRIIAVKWEGESTEQVTKTVKLS